MTVSFQRFWRSYTLLLSKQNVQLDKITDICGRYTIRFRWKQNAYFLKKLQTSVVRERYNYYHYKNFNPFTSKCFYWNTTKIGNNLKAFYVICTASIDL